MDDHPADILLEHAKKNLYGSEKSAPNPLHAYRILDAIIGIFPDTDEAREAAGLLRNAGQIPSDERAESF